MTHWVISRMSVHHWRDVPRALAEVYRVLKPGGRVKFIDVAGIDDPLYDTHIQAIELLRDGSHIRDYRADEWIAMFDAAGFDVRIIERWRIPLEFESWVTRMRTSAERVAAIRSMWTSAPDEVRQYFGVQSDCSFELDALMIEGVWVGFVQSAAGSLLQLAPPRRGEAPTAITNQQRFARTQPKATEKAKRPEASPGPK